MLSTWSYRQQRIINLQLRRINDNRYYQIMQTDINMFMFVLIEWNVSIQHVVFETNVKVWTANFDSWWVVLDLAH